jgi:hypothetical protein
LLTSTGAWLPIAAAVLDVGRFEQSPVRDGKGEREKGTREEGEKGRARVREDKLGKGSWPI